MCYFGKDFNELQALEKVAIESQRNYEFIKIESDDLRTQLKYKYRELVLFKSYDENQISMAGTDTSPLSYEMIKHFLKKYGHPLIMEYDEKTKSYLFDQNNYFIFFLRKGTQQMNEIMNSVALAGRLAKEPKVIQGKNGNFVKITIACKVSKEKADELSSSIMER